MEQTEENSPIERAEKRREIKYSFEELSVREKGKEPRKVASELTKMLNRIEVDTAILDDNIELELLNYVRMYHMNIEWYINKIKEVSKKKGDFFITGVLLLIGIPVITFTITGIFKGLTPTLLGAIIVLFLTIVLALYKATSVWLEAKKFEGIFWKASSALKNRLYEFENKWEERVDKDNLTEFISDLEKEIIEGRKIVQEETESYFENFTTPILDVPSILSTANSQANSILNSFQSPSFKRRMENEVQALANKAKLEDNYRQVAFLQKKQELLVDRIKSVSDQLRLEKDPSQKKKIESIKETLESELQACVHQTMIKEAESILYE